MSSRDKRNNRIYSIAIGVRGAQGEEQELREDDSGRGGRDGAGRADGGEDQGQRLVHHRARELHPGKEQGTVPAPAVLPQVSLSLPLGPEMCNCQIE